MTDFHRNVFSYFMGASQPDRDREKQLEDNTTKALVNTLEHCKRNVASAFLKWLGIPNARSVNYMQQRNSIGEDRIQRKSQRMLLAIVGKRPNDGERLFEDLSHRNARGSRPDAWLYGDDFVVLIESKIGDANLNLNQLACHWQKLHPTTCKIVTWSEVHAFFTGLMCDVTDARSRWLTEQFTQYLEWTGMTEFVGFKEEMFEFFVGQAHDRDAETKRWVRGAVDALGEKVLNGKEGLKSFDDFYSDKHVGNLTSDSDHYWLAFGPAKDFRDQAHQTISLYEQWLDVFVNVELLSPIKRLRRKITDGGFRKVVCDLPVPFTLHIGERKKTKRPRKFDYIQIADIEAGIHKRRRYGLKDASSTGFDYIEKLLFDIEFPYLSLRRRIDRNRVLQLSKPNGDALVAEVLDILKGFHPLVDFINE